MIDIMFRLAGAYPAAAAVGVVTTAFAAVVEIIR